MPEFDYTGPYRYFVTITTHQEMPIFLGEDNVSGAVLALSEVAGRYGFDVLCYCFMPEHVHFLVEGHEGSDLRKFVRTYKQVSSFRYKTIHGYPMWQRGYYDHVLRRDEVVPVVARYILNNPLRRGLSDDAAAYGRSGSFVCPIAEILRG